MYSADRARASACLPAIARRYGASRVRWQFTSAVLLPGGSGQPLARWDTPRSRTRELPCRFTARTLPRSDEEIEDERVFEQPFRLFRRGSGRSRRSSHLSPEPGRMGRDLCRRRGGPRHPGGAGHPRGGRRASLVRRLEHRRQPRCRHILPGRGDLVARGRDHRLVFRRPDRRPPLRDRARQRRAPARFRRLVRGDPGGLLAPGVGVQRHRQRDGQRSRQHRERGGQGSRQRRERRGGERERRRPAGGGAQSGEPERRAEAYRTASSPMSARSSAATSSKPRRPRTRR